MDLPEGITEIRIRKFDSSGGKLKAFANITFLGKYVLSGVKVMESDRGLWVSMPAQKGSDDQWHDIFFPVTREAREELHNAVLQAYENESGNMASNSMTGSKPAVSPQAPSQAPTPQTPQRGGEDVPW